MRKGWIDACVAAWSKDFDSPLVEKDNWGGFRYEEGYTAEDGTREEATELEEEVKFVLPFFPLHSLSYEAKLTRGLPTNSSTTTRSKSKSAFPKALAEMQSASIRKAKGKEREKDVLDDGFVVQHSDLSFERNIPANLASSV